MFLLITQVIESVFVQESFFLCLCIFFNFMQQQLSRFQFFKPLFWYFFNNISFIIFVQVSFSVIQNGTINILPQLKSLALFDNIFFHNFVFILYFFPIHILAMQYGSIKITLSKMCLFLRIFTRYFSCLCTVCLLFFFFNIALDSLKPLFVPFTFYLRSPNLQCRIKDTLAKKKKSLGENVKIKLNRMNHDIF